MTAQAAAGADPDHVSLRAWVAVLGGVVGCFMAGMNVHVTNASLPDVRGSLGASFEAIHDIHAMDLAPKPAPSAYAGLCAAFGLDPAQSLFVDDMARNLAPAKAIGMTTVWVDNGSEQAEGTDRSFVDYTTHDLTHWLQGIL